MAYNRREQFISFGEINPNDWVELATAVTVYEAYMQTGPIYKTSAEESKTFLISRYDNAYLTKQEIHNLHLWMTAWIAARGIKRVTVGV